MLRNFGDNASYAGSFPPGQAPAGHSHTVSFCLTSGPASPVAFWVTGSAQLISPFTPLARWGRGEGASFPPHLPLSLPPTPPWWVLASGCAPRPCARSSVQVTFGGTGLWPVGLKESSFPHQITLSTLAGHHRSSKMQCIAEPDAVWACCQLGIHLFTQNFWSRNQIYRKRRDAGLWHKLNPLIDIRESPSRLPRACWKLCGSCLVKLRILHPTTSNQLSAFQ